jgi:hypothetical protein
MPEELPRLLCGAISTIISISTIKLKMDWYVSWYVRRAIFVFAPQRRLNQPVVPLKEYAVAPLHFRPCHLPPNPNPSTTSPHLVTHLASGGFPCIPHRRRPALPCIPQIYRKAAIYLHLCGLCCRWPLSASKRVGGQQQQPSI